MSIKPRWAHQDKALDFIADKPCSGLFMEQRTGKSRVIIEDAARQYKAGNIEVLAIAAPNGVHRNWLSEEVPAYMPEDIPVRSTYWDKNTKKSVMKALEDILDNKFMGLRIFTINLEALSTPRGYDQMEKFLKSVKVKGKAMLVVDESYRIKEPGTSVSKKLSKLRNLANFRRILNGTPNPEGPLDLYGQLDFLGDEALPVRSYVAYSNRYAEYLPATHPLIRGIMNKNPMIRQPPRIVATNEDGSPRYKNLEELKNWVSKWCFRVTRQECREDLPEKIFTKWPVEIEPHHDKIIRMKMQAIKDGTTDEPISKLNAAQYLQRMLCGYLPSKLSEDAVLESIYSDPMDNPRIQACLDIANAYPNDSIVFWARYTIDVENIGKLLKKKFGDESVVLYYGGVSNADREIAKKSFQDGTAKYFVGQPAAGGVGLPLYRAGVMVYHSNDFKLFIRLQSEDRAEHMEMTRGTVIIDITVPGTMDDDVIDSLRAKKDVADLITGDKTGRWMNYK